MENFIKFACIQITDHNQMIQMNGHASFGQCWIIINGIYLKYDNTRTHVCKLVQALSSYLFISHAQSKYPLLAQSKYASI